MIKRCQEGKKEREKERKKERKTRRGNSVEEMGDTHDAAGLVQFAQLGSDERAIQ